MYSGYTKLQKILLDLAILQQTFEALASLTKL